MSDDQHAAETVLIIDDDAAVRDVARRTLERGGYHGVEAACGEEALAHLDSANNTTRVALLDWSMPGLGGPATLDAILDKYPQTSVVVISGWHLTEHDVPRSHRVEVVSKPFQTEVLLNAVANGLRVAEV